MLPTAIVAYLALFATVGFLFVLASLLLGRFLRAACADPAEVGDLRVRRAGRGAGIGPVRPAVLRRGAGVPDLRGRGGFLLPAGDRVRQGRPACAESAAKRKTAGTARQATEPRNGKRDSAAADEKQCLTPSSARRWRWPAMLDLGVFFAVLLVGFAFVWRRGDLDWVRAVRHPATPAETAALDGQTATERSLTHERARASTPDCSRPSSRGWWPTISRPSIRGSRSRPRAWPRSAAICATSATWRSTCSTASRRSTTSSRTRRRRPRSIGSRTWS